MIGGVIVIAIAVAAVGFFALTARSGGQAGSSPTPALAVAASPKATATASIPSAVITPEVTLGPTPTVAPEVTLGPTPTVAPEVTATVTAAAPTAVPPKPTNTRLETISDTFSADGTSETLIEKVSWDAPRGVATEFRLYAVKFCPNDTPSAQDGTPCLTVHTALPPDELEFVASAPGDARSMTIKHVIGEGICPNTLWCEDTYALVLAAYNEIGQSVFTIVKSTDICHTCVY